MKYQEIFVLLPCHSLEDFPLHHQGDDAQGLLANWTAPWHPALIHSAGAKPKWQRADDPPVELADRLILVPSVAMDRLPTGFEERVRQEGGRLLGRLQQRDEIIARSLEGLDADGFGEPSDADRRPIDQDLVADFLALGYGYLQVQLLTRQMRYSSNLDELYFDRQVVAAAAAAVQGDAAVAREKLTACFDALSQERDHFYPVDAFLLDITLVAETTVGPSLREELNSTIPVNLLLSAQAARAMAEHEPDTLQQLRQALASARIGLAGAEEAEGRPTLISCETLLSSLRAGVATYQRLLDHRLTIYGRRRFGLTSALPQLLRKLGLRGALHFTLDDGQFPQGSQIKIRWEGDDGSSIDALARPPFDAAKPESFLGLAVKLGESMDSDHVATVCLAHWPGQASCWYEDLRRVCSYCSALGKPVTLDEYFEKTDSPGHQEHFECDQYRSPYLKQAAIRNSLDPISTIVRYWQRRATAESSRNLAFLTQLIRLRADASDDPRLSDIDQTVESGDADPLDQQLDAALQAATSELVASLPPANSPAQQARIVLNPCSYVRRIAVEQPDWTVAADPQRPVYSSSKVADRVFTVVDVPPMGFACITPGRAKPVDRGKARLLVSEGALRNEFFQAVIDPETGGLRALYDYESRGIRLGQQLAYRARVRPSAHDGSTKPSAQTGDAPTGEESSYSTMKADEVQVTISCETMAEVVTRGKLIGPQGRELADFRQTFRIWRGVRVLYLDVELNPRHEPKTDPWNSYYACRFAWSDESAQLAGAILQTRQTLRLRRFESPLYVDIDDAVRRTTILTGGLPFHRRHQFNMLDTLLIVRGESARRFQLGIGVDLKNPLHDALALIAPPTSLAVDAPAPSAGTSSWLFHIDHRSVIATHWSPLTEADQVVGFRVRLLETQGRPARGKLSSFRPARSAQVVDFLDQTLADCRIDEGAVHFELSAHEWSELKVRTGG